MADEFDIIDIVFDAVVSVSDGFAVYKDCSLTGERENHIVINHTECRELTNLNSAHINVNIFVKNHDNGMPDRQLIKSSKRIVEMALKNIDSFKSVGQYLTLEKQYSAPINDAKEGFFCTNIKLITAIEK